MPENFHLKEKLKEKMPASFKTKTKKLCTMLKRLGRVKRKPRKIDNKLCIFINFSIITALGLVIFRNFIFTSEWPGGGDVLGIISRAYLYGKDFRWLYVWRMYSFGFPEGINSFDFFLLLIYSVFRDPSVTTKVLMFLSFLVAGFSMYAFAYRYTRKHLAALSAALFYTLNQWFFSQFMEAHGDILFSYALAPLLFLLLDRALLSGKPKDSAVFAAFFAVFLTGFHPECIVIYGLFILIFVAFYVFVRSKNGLKARVRHLLKVSLIVGVVSSLFSAFSLLPLFSNLSPPYYSTEYRYYLEEAESGSFQRIADAFTLKIIERWGYGFVLSSSEDISLPDFPTTTVLAILLLLAYSTILFQRDRYTYFFAFATLVSIIISMGPHSWFGEVFVWAWFNVPHFAVFRATSRWIMMAAFSHSFFISILVCMLQKHLQKKTMLKSEGNNSKEFYGNFQPPKLRLSLTKLDDFYRSLYKIFYYIGILLLVLVLFISFISCFFFFDRGLQVYSPPSSYLEPYEWLASQPGDYKVVTVMRSAGEWWGDLGAASDFGYSGMFTDIGWGHDIGHDSSFIHDKPVLQNGGWDPFARAFVDHLRFQLARENLTDDMLKMLGTLNYRYVVIPSYASENIRNFFLNQEGAQVIQNLSGSLLVENSFYTPHIFAATQQAIVVGGLQAFSSLCKIESFHLNQTPLVFAHQMNSSALLANLLLSTSQSLIFVDSGMLDFVMMSLRDDSIMINPVKYSAASMNHSKYWVQDQYWTAIGSLVLNRETLTTIGKNCISIPFKLDTSEPYDLWMRLAFAPNRGKLQILIDNVLCGEICPQSMSIIGLIWSNITRLNLQRGDHTITISNDGSGFNDVDAIAFVKPLLFQQRLNAFNETIRNFQGRLVFIKEAEHLEANGLSLISWPLNDRVLHSEGRGRIISYEGTATASSVESPGLEAEKAIDASTNSRWSSMRGVPQWLQVEWGSTQKVAGIHIIFEQALAKDYVIQTWNGDSWINQFNVTGNTLRERFHDFLNAVNTTKVRIYVTRASDFGTTSIWEFEVYSQTGDMYTTTKIFSTLKGEYMIATRVGVGPDYGTLYIETNQTESPISCESSKKGFEWREVGPLSFDFGEQEIRLKAVGKIDLDTTIIYSLKSNENYLSVNDLFNESSAPPSIRYEKINPCNYKVHVDGGGPFLLVFSEAYHPLWKAYVNGVEKSPFTALYTINGYYIDGADGLDISLHFTPQDFADVGLKISLISFDSTLIVAVVWSKPLERLRKHVKTGVRNMRARVRWLST